MLKEQFKAVIYTLEGEYIEELGEEVLGLDSYSIGPFPMYDMAKDAIMKEALVNAKFDHASIEKVFVWED